MDLQEFMMRGVQCGMRYSKVGMIWTREESCVWGDGVSVRRGSVGCGMAGWVESVSGSVGVERG